MSTGNLTYPRNTVLRCPFCMVGMQTEESPYSRGELTCDHCGQSFRIREALPDRTAPGKIETVWSPQKKKSSITLKLLVALALVSGVGLATCLIGREWDGISFFFLYSVAFLFLVVSAFVLRHALGDRYLVSLVCCLVFECIGGERIWFGYSQGLDTFNLLPIMMVLGGLVFFLRAKSETGGRYGLFGGCGLDFTQGGHSSRSSGGGGGCGGAGCGGCGS